MKADCQAGLQSMSENSKCLEDSSPEKLWDQLNSANLQTSDDHQEEQRLVQREQPNESRTASEDDIIPSPPLTQPSCPVRRASFRFINSILQRKLQEIKNKSWIKLSKRNQQYAYPGDYRGFYKALKAVYISTHRVQSPLCSEDGQILLADKASILSRLSVHFQFLFSADRVVQDPAVLRIPQQPFKAELDKLPSVKEITKVIE